MKRYDKYYDKVQGALTDGWAVCGLAQDGKSNICINAEFEGNYLKRWNIGLMIVYENSGIYNEDVEGVITLFQTDDTSLDSMRDVIDIFLTLVNKSTIEVMV
jgi:hypothetical protein